MADSPPGTATSPRHVTPGQTAWITVGVTDRADEISYASNYAKHYIGGILRESKASDSACHHFRGCTLKPISIRPFGMRV